VTVSGSVPLQSMTGYGRAVAETPLGSLEVDLRSVNHRAFKLTFRVAEEFNAAVPKLEAELKKRFARGALHLSVRLLRPAEAASPRLDGAALKSYFAQLRSLCEELGEEPPRLAELLGLPGVLSRSESGVSVNADGASSLLAEPLARAGDSLRRMREDEGVGLGAELLALLTSIRSLVADIALRVPADVEAQGARLEERLARLLEAKQFEPDQRDLAQQVAAFAERCDISEEVQRLEGHVSAALGCLEEGGAVGRKLEFLGQEMQREANTMASKSRGLGTIDRILEVKLLVDRIREQTANLE
jgi:uncharacterized protein (TIGR00255 family)